MRRTQSTFALAVAAALAAATVTSVAWAALTPEIPRAELMKAGPLGEEALGPDAAPVTIIEYASMTCPHCARFNETTFPALKNQFIDTGKVRFIFREFPLDPVAAGAFMLARCAPRGKYFTVIDLFFRTQEQWAVPKPLPHMLAIAKQAGFTDASAKACLADQKLLDGIDWVRNRAAKEFHVDATPTFFINGKKYVGELSIEQLERAIGSDLSG
jgi:protein-disulfide isomerase